MITYRCIRIALLHELCSMIYYVIEQCTIECMKGCMKGRVKGRKNGDNYYDQDGFLITEDYVVK